MHFSFVLSVKKKKEEEEEKKKVLNICWLCLLQVLTESKEYLCTSFPYTLYGLPKISEHWNLIYIVSIRQIYGRQMIFVCFFILIPSIPIINISLFLAFCAFASWMRLLETSDTLITHLLSLFLWISLGIAPCLVLVQYHGHLNYAFWVYRKHQRALHIWLDKLYLRLENVQRILAVIFSAVTPNLIVFALLNCSNEQKKEMSWKLTKIIFILQ